MTSHYPAKNGYFGSSADAYDSTRFSSVKGKWLDAREKRAVGQALRCINKDSTILDLPCGTGRITEYVLAQGYRVAGADVSSDMIALARERTDNHKRLLGYYECDAERIGLPSDSFDCITCVRLMGHLPPNTKIMVLREMATVAKHYLIITFYLAGPLRSIKWLMMHRTTMRSAPWYPVTHKELEKLFSACSLNPIGRWSVCSLLSDAVVYLLSVSDD